MEEKEIRTAQASSFLEIIVKCPYCWEYQDHSDRLSDHLDTGELRAISCNAEITCSENDCKRVFIVDSIEY